MLLFFVNWWWALILGAIGGLLRGILGISKDLVSKKEVVINWPWFVTTVLVAAILGAITASFFADDLRIAVLGGYSGSDFVDGLMKLKLKELFTPKPVVKTQATEVKTGDFGKLIKAPR